ncbi:MAG: pilus assembly protein [Candidatus Binataceae bacterium]|nr:pilus assembly protein [Candidatus Binataceae bacterium]
MKFLTAWRCRRSYRAGQTLLEFALAATLLFLLIFGIMEMALAVYSYNTVCSAAREAVRYAIVHSPTGPNPSTTSQIQQVAIDYAVDLNPKQLTVNVSWPNDANLPSQADAQVQVSYHYQLQIPSVSPVTLTLSSTSRMLVSQ